MSKPSDTSDNRSKNEAPSRPSGADVEEVHVGNATYYVRKDVEAQYNRLDHAMRCADGRQKLKIGD